jgi:hypothetical protein
VAVVEEQEVVVAVEEVLVLSNKTPGHGTAADADKAATQAPRVSFFLC